MYSILLHLTITALYVGLARHFWRARWKGTVLSQPAIGLSHSERGILLLTLILHGIALNHDIFPDASMHFGFSEALSLMLWLAIALYWMESFHARMEGLQILGFPLAAGCVMLPELMPSRHILTNIDSPAFRLHFLIAMLAYSLFTLAALHAILMAAAEKNLHRGRFSPFFVSLPPLLTMESLLFRLIHTAFALLTLTLLSGILFSEALFGKALSLDHKTIFAFLSWLIFAALLLGRHLRGWRGRLALHWTLSGFATLLLAYVGSQFVVEVILGRVN